MSATPAAWLAGFGGAFLVWAAIHNESPAAAIRSALTGAGGGGGGATIAAPISYTSRAGSVAASAAAAGTGAVAGPVNTAGAAFTAAAASVAGILASSVPPALVSIGYKSHRLAAPAAAGYASASAKFGTLIPITDSFRTSAQQAACHKAKPTICAPAGTSKHEKGLAIDVDTSRVDPNDSRLISALAGSGWVRYNATKEPWHWSYGVVG